MKVRNLKLNSRFDHQAIAEASAAFYNNLDALLYDQLTSDDSAGSSISVDSSKMRCDTAAVATSSGVRASVIVENNLR